MSNSSNTYHITAIKKQVKHPDRYSLFVNEKYHSSLSGAALLDSGLAVGAALNEQELADLKRLSVADKLYGMALRWATLRPRSEWELAMYLQKKQIDPGDAQNITDQFKEAGFINDEEFARSWVRSRRSLKSMSTRKLQQELRLKRVDTQTITKVLSEDDTDEQQVLKELIEKKRQQSKYKDDTKLMQYLYRQGFSYGDIKAALKDKAG